LPAADDERAGRPRLQTESAALALLSLLVVATAAPAAAGDGRPRDDRDAVLLVRVGEHSPDRDRLSRLAEQLIEFHAAPPPDRRTGRFQHPTASPGRGRRSRPPAGRTGGYARAAGPACRPVPARPSTQRCHLAGRVRTRGLLTRDGMM